LAEASVAEAFLTMHESGKGKSQPDADEIARLRRAISEAEQVGK
jgi:hypothetical protein